MLEQKKNKRVGKDKIAVLALWFVVLIAVRVLLGFVLHNVWIGTLGAVTITFAIFYITLRYTTLQKYRQLINSSLNYWYRKKFFYISGIVSLVILGGILGFIEYGYANYADRLITVDFTQQQVEESFGSLTANQQMQANLVENLRKYSPVEIIAITLASADKTLDGYYSIAVSYMIAEDFEIMIFMMLFRTRREIFTARPPNVA
ncbi:MAG: hypothetical protein AUJ08_02005 [Thaumarchaeota archaeon 13_1_40CM_3_50_5]|nr:MAG: hypothetical protein AUJ08_02005 [Thaumarchaeota archaeon 13_1_40CM_3_50_5]TLY12016.1 MAG: hypothetical protein E6K88_00175 [Nitrososphaerota archaeon]